MIPVISPEHMREIDALCGVPEGVLIERAGRVVAEVARSMLGGVYGRRVAVLAGPGNNGADGRVAARILAGWGVRVRTIDVGHGTLPPARVDDVDLLIDAMFGTGAVRAVRCPEVGADTKVLAVDIPSGVDALTGQVIDGSVPLRADVTVSFVAPKPGLLFEPGASFVGELVIGDIGIGPTPGTVIRTQLLDEATVRSSLAHATVSSHKWKHAVLVVAGSPGMTGAAVLSAHGASRSGASLVRLAIPGGLHSGDEIVGVPLPSSGWASTAAEWAQRCAAVVLGPGLGSSESTRSQVRELLSVLAPEVPVILDGDGLGAVTPSLLNALNRPIIVTPHDGEFRQLTGRPPGVDRIAAAVDLAVEANVVVLLKGPTTVVASPAGDVEVVREADQRLATAGSGDVLAGVIAAFCAHGVPLVRAASMAAFVHGRAAIRGRAVGLIAGDLPPLLADVLSDWAAEVSTRRWRRRDWSHDDRAVPPHNRLDRPRSGSSQHPRVR